MPIPRTKEESKTVQEMRALLFLPRKGDTAHEKAVSYTLKWIAGAAVTIAIPLAIVIDHKTGHYWPGYAESAVLYGAAQVISRLKYRSLLRKSGP